MESRYRMYQDQPRMQELLCGAYVETLKGDGTEKLFQRFRINVTTAHARVAPPVEEAADDFREFDE